MNTPFDYGKLAYDRTEIADALYRYAAGLDLGDADLLSSAFTEDVIFDFASAASKIGVQFPVLSARDVVVKTLLAVLGPLDTSHSLSNLRMTISGERATLQAYVLAQHFSPGEGPRPDQSRHALLMGRYDASLVRDAELWRISRLTIDTVWFEGDPTIVTALPAGSLWKAEESIEKTR
ncbi:nuclear transport factor 2 family protein [Reticulibacter mediterranei]|nr:nuclear transport factor 2 family protein [Reticulibacter mediterranei]